MSPLSYALSRRLHALIKHTDSEPLYSALGEAYSFLAFFFFPPHEKPYWSSLLHFGFGPQMLISLVFLQKVCLRSRLWKVDGRGLFHVLQKVLGNSMQIYFLSLALFCYLHYLCVCVCVCVCCVCLCVCV